MDPRGAEISGWAPPPRESAERRKEEACTSLLLKLPGIGPAWLTALVAAFGSAEAALQVVKAGGAGPPEAAAAARHLPPWEEEAEAMESLGVRCVFPGEAEFPPWLRRSERPPAVLFVQGGAALEGLEDCVAVVGTRRATAYGEEVARRLSAGLARAGVAVVSGGARGIDAAAHRGVLEVEGVTVVVMASGAGRPFPPEHAVLFDEVVSSGGALVSEWPPGVPPERWRFPVRNRLIAGMGWGVVVVEAGERSGALITARLGAELGREVMAVPGSVRSPWSRGCHQLIREGAALVEGVEDILRHRPRWLAREEGVPAEEALEEETGVGRRALPPSGAPGLDARVPGPFGALLPDSLRGVAQKLLACLGDEALTQEALASRVGVELPRVLAALVALEVAGAVRRRGDGLVEKVFSEPA